MTSSTSPEYVLARRVLLDALDALGPHRDAVVLVGAQAVYQHTGDTDLAVAPTTTDADIALAPSLLRDEPLLEAALRAAGFTLGVNPGTWHGTGGIAIDLMVPEALSGSGKGKRGARIPLHGNQVARRTLGLEAALVDNQEHALTALDPADVRRFTIRVAGPAALLIAKAIKVEERLEHPHRLKPKDGLDMLRLLQAVEAEPLAQGLHRLGSDALAGEVTRKAVGILRQHGTTPDGPLALLAMQAVGILDDPDVITESFAVLVQEVLAAYDLSAGVGSSAL
ncbi:GSU2403 family nucleotidyltransferase fold protein [Nonomuraea glycinis]|uniref:GSU2403 family nucleotidyltransferase fold protein n=1 Tax=Nonomuraea glycinis TaxID=2047744 RepID=UPI0033BE5345